MILGVLKETKEKERRVALSPEVVKLLLKKEFQIQVESGAGVASNFSDEAYKVAGAQLASKNDIFNSYVILNVNAPTREEASQFKNGTASAAFSYHYTQ